MVSPSDHRRLSRMRSVANVESLLSPLPTTPGGAFSFRSSTLRVLHSEKLKKSLHKLVMWHPRPRLSLGEVVVKLDGEKGEYSFVAIRSIGIQGDRYHVLI